MKPTYLRFLLSLALATVPASVAYTLLGYYLMPDVSSRTVPDDCIDFRRYPLFMAREVMRELIEQFKVQARGGK